MSQNPIRENEFSPAPGGTNGTVNYSAPWGTPFGPETSQNPNQFQHSDDNKAENQKGKPPIKSTEDAASVEKDVNAIYSKKDTPTPDEVVAGIKYEMGQQIKKDKLLAKQAVLKNLKKDPHYYGDLKMLNIDDKSMVDNMNESKHPNDNPARPKISVNIEETKKIFAAMSQGNQKKYVVNSKLVEIMNQMVEDKKHRSDWKKSG